MAQQSTRISTGEDRDGELVVLVFTARVKPANARQLAEQLVKRADAIEARQARSRSRKRK